MSADHGCCDAAPFLRLKELFQAPLGNSSNAGNDLNAASALVGEILLSAINFSRLDQIDLIRPPLTSLSLFFQPRATSKRPAQAFLFASVITRVHIDAVF